MATKVWTYQEWIEFWGDGKLELRDFLWSIMVDTYRRDHDKQRSRQSNAD